MHYWLRAECRANEKRSPLTPEGATALRAAGHELTVEANANRCFADEDFARAGATIVPAGAWETAPQSATILGLKELPDAPDALIHDHIMFGHAFKGQSEGPALLARFTAGGGALLDLEYLVDDAGRRQAAFGYWAGFAGAAVSLLALAAARNGRVCAPVGTFENADAMTSAVRAAMAGHEARALIIGALGRVGSGARAMCAAVGVPTTDWDMDETRHGGPFPEILDHEVFLNCILAGPETPNFVPQDAGGRARSLRVIGDIACDPSSDFNPIPLYDQATSWAEPVVRVADAPPLDIMAIDNLPSLLPLESSQDFAGQLLPLLLQLGTPDDRIWTRARATFKAHAGAI